MATKINNHMQRDLIMRPPHKNAAGLVIPSVAHDAMTLIIKPGHYAVCEFWDEIKDNKIYQNHLDVGHITTGDDSDLAPGGSEPFTSFGDTLAPPESLNPEIDATEAENDPAKVQLAYGDNKEPVISTKRRGRKPKEEAAKGSE